MDTSEKKSKAPGKPAVIETDEQPSMVPGTQAVYHKPDELKKEVIEDVNPPEVKTHTVDVKVRVIDDDGIGALVNNVYEFGRMQFPQGTKITYHISQAEGLIMLRISHFGISAIKNENGDPCEWMVSLALVERFQNSWKTKLILLDELDVQGAYLAAIREARRFGVLPPESTKWVRTDAKSEDKVFALAK